jgi:hypothetical protein
MGRWNRFEKGRGFGGLSSTRPAFLMMARLDEMADKLRGGPAAFAGTGCPLTGWNGIGGGQELRFGASKIFGDRSQRGHSLPIVSSG